MRKYLIIGLLALASCTSADDISNEPFDIPEIDTDCGEYNGHTLHKGPQGGCYYYSSGGNKVYVDRDLCDC